MKKTLSRWDSAAIITAIVIGVGIFKVPAEVAGFLWSPRLIMAAWFLGGVISLLGAICYAELSSSLPETGGNYVYLRESYGDLAGFLFGWTELLVVRAGSIAAVAFIAAEYFSSLLSLDTLFVKPAAVLTVLALCLVNIRGLDRGKKIHNVLSAVNISAIVLMVVFGFLSGKGDIRNFRNGGLAPAGDILPLLGLALVPILWTYGGWHENTFAAGETKDAARTLPQALIGGVLAVTGLYLAANCLYIYLMPVKEIAGSCLIGSDVFRVLYGPYGRRIFEAVVVMASVGGINAMIITGSRVTYAMAKDNRIFAYLEKTGGRYGAPYRAIMVTGAWASVLILQGTFAELLFFTGILFWLFFAMSVAGIFRLRKKFPDIPRPYKVWGYPVTPFIFILVCAGLFINTLVFSPLPALAGLFLLASGVPVYIFSRINTKKGGS